MTVLCGKLQQNVNIALETQERSEKGGLYLQQYHKVKPDKHLCPILMNWRVLSLHNVCIFCPGLLGGLQRLLTRFFYAEGGGYSPIPLRVLGQNDFPLSGKNLLSSF